MCQVAWVPSAVAGDGTVTAAVAVTLPAMGEGGSDYAYVGSSKCKKCHLKQHKSWKTTKKYQAFEALLPGNAEEIKQKHGLDPSKDYSKDENCVKCHTTGYGHEGGYAMIAPSGDPKAAKKMKKLANVGCESCHGPGSAYIELHEEIMKSKRKYKVEETYAVGLRKIEASVCITCHNENSPTYDASTPFDYEQMKDKGTHEHIPLKQRAD